MKTELEKRRLPEQKRSKNTLDNILTASKSIFAEKGMDVVSMSQISASAGVSKAALYRYFPNKQAIIKELAKQHFEQTRALLFGLFSQEGESFEELMVRGIRDYCRLHASSPFSMQLKAAIYADPMLSDLNLDDSEQNAQLLADFFCQVSPSLEHDITYLRSLLFIESLDGLIKILARMSEEKSEQLIAEFTRIFLSNILS